MNPIPIGLTAESNYTNICSILDRTRHFLTVGQTGTGKSTVLENICIAALREGTGFSAFDPHGLFADKILESVPRSRKNDIYVFDPSNPNVDWDMGLNFFDSYENKAHRVEGIVTVFRKLYGQELFGPASATLLRNSCMALYDQDEIPTLLRVQKFLLDRDYRLWCCKRLKNRRTELFFKKYDHELKEATREEKTSPLMNKLEPLLNDPILLRIFSQERSSFNLRKIMDSSKVLVCKLPNGIIGEDGSSLLGSLILSLLFEAAISRQDTRKPLPLHMVVMDEFQTFTHSTSIRQILQEARKYRLCAYLGTQTLEVLGDADKAAMLGNTATKVWFRAGWEDAETFRKESATNREAREFQDTYTFYAWVRMLQKDKDGIERPTGPHKVRLFPPTEKEGNEVPRDELIAHSLQRYARPRKEIEEKLQKVLGSV